MTNVLPLRAVTLTSINSLGVVAAWMFAPDDAEWRGRLQAHFAALDGLDRWRRGDLSRQRHVVDDLVRLALAAPSLEMMRPELTVRAERGFAAGMVLYNAHFRILRGERSPVGRSVEELRPSFQRAANSDSKHFREIILPRYRPVAALWAAFIACEGSQLLENRALDQFPCAPSGLPLFLAIAEQMRELHENVVPPRRSEPLLRPGVSVVVPDEVRAALPEGSLTTSTVPSAVRG